MSVLVDAGDGQGLVDLSTFGFLYTRRAGDLTPALGAPPSTPIPGRFGARLTGAAASVAARRITVPGTLFSDTPGAFVTALRALITHCTGNAGGPTSQPVTLAFSDASGTAPTVGFTAYLAEPTTFDRFDPVEVTTMGPLSLAFDCPDPLAYDLTPQAIALTTGFARTPLGTALSWPTLTFPGPFSARTVTLVDGTDTTVQSLTLTGAVGSGESLVLDMGAELLTHVVSGVATPVADWLTSGDFFACDPVLRRNGIEPGLKLAAGTGTAAYAKAWR